MRDILVVKRAKTVGREQGQLLWRLVPLGVLVFVRGVFWGGWDKVSDLVKDLEAVAILEVSQVWAATVDLDYHISNFIKITFLLWCADRIPVVFIAALDIPRAMLFVTWCLTLSCFFIYSCHWSLEWTDLARKLCFWRVLFLDLIRLDLVLLVEVLDILQRVSIVFLRHRLSLLSQVFQRRLHVMLGILLD